MHTIVRVRHKNSKSEVAKGNRGWVHGSVTVDANDKREAGNKAIAQIREICKEDFLPETKVEVVQVIPLKRTRR